MYAVTVTFEIELGRMDEFFPLMIENARASRETEPGCRMFDVCRQGNTIFLYELYDDPAAFEDHLASSHFRSFDAAIVGMIAEKTVHTFTEVHR